MVLGIGDAEGTNRNASSFQGVLRMIASTITILPLPW
jgi:hypothetical protein